MKTPSFRALVSDIKAQPDWRGLSDRCCAYYDHVQLTEEQIEDMKRLGMPDIVENLIQAPINSVLGNEAQRRRDWMVVADDDDSQEVAEGLNAKLNETLRLCEANSRCSEAYASQIKSGIGWLHVRRNPDPFGTPYLIEHIHRDEIYFDLRSRAQDLSDMRWIARRKFLDADEARTLLPQKFHDLIDMLGKNWSDYDSWEFADEAAGHSGINQSRFAEWETSNQHIEYIMDTQRKRVAMYEVYYREPTKVIAIKLPDGRVEALNQKQPSQEHVQAILRKEAVMMPRTVMQMRCRWYLGCHLIKDDVSPYPHQHFPYIPFFGYREDKTNIPYSVIRGMIDPQDVYNNTNIRIQHILNTKRVMVEEGALPANMTVSDLVHEVNRKDGVVIFKKGSSITVEQDWQELHRLVDIRNAAEQKVRDIAGIFNEFSGKGASGQSGVAIASLAELGSITLAEINDNYEYARKKLAELVLAYLIKDMGNRPTEVAINEGISQNKKRVVLNAVSPKTGLDNSVVRAKYQVAIAPIQSSAGYRQNQHQRLMDMYAASPDNLKMIILPMVIESSELPRREEILKKLNESMGVIDDPEQQAEALKAQQEQAAKAQALEQAGIEADIALKQSQALEHQADAEHQQAKAAEILSRLEVEREDRKRLEDQRKQQLIDQTRDKLFGRGT